MTLSPSHAPVDLGKAQGIISHLGDILKGSQFLNDLQVPDNGVSIVEQLSPEEASKILSTTR